MPLLEVRELSHRYGGLVALAELSLRLSAGTITALVGPNGAGKSTLFDCLSGIVQPQTGHIVFAGRPLNGLSTHHIARAGLVRTFQNLDLFRDMTVEDNLLVARHRFLRAGLWRGLFNWGQNSFSGRQDRAQAEVIGPLLRRFDLWQERGRIVCNLPYGIRKRVELARALAVEPVLLLLDEPTAGLTTLEREDLAERLREWVHERGLTLLFVEHHWNFVHALAQQVMVLSSGRLLASGSPGELAVLPEVRDAYLGEFAAARRMPCSS